MVGIELLEFKIDQKMELRFAKEEAKRSIL
jgi:hypothetical protein